MTKRLHIKLSFLIFLLCSLSGSLLAQTQTVRDEFATINYSNNDGTQNWSSDWIELNDNRNRVNDGLIKIVNGELRFNRLSYNNRQIKRSVDLSGATSATLSFNVNASGLSWGRRLYIQISTDGTSFSDLDFFDRNTNTNKTYDISAYMSSSTTIRFINNRWGNNYKWGNNDYAYIDNVEISYVIDDVPPVFQNPQADITVNASGDECGTLVDYQIPQVTDNSSAFSGNLSAFSFLGKFNNHTYYYSDEGAYATTAIQNAISKGGHLVTITSQAENDFVSSQVGEIWIGLTDAATEGTFVWENGEPVTYVNWRVDEPNNSGNEDYTEMYDDGEWNDLADNSWERYVVEFESTLVTQTGGLPSGSVFPVGTTVNTFLATDNSGNTSTYSFNVTVVDATPPAISPMQADYYDGTNFDTFKETLPVEELNYSWDAGTPESSLVGADYFSIRFQGNVKAPQTGTYTFYTTSDDGVRLWVDGQLIVDNWTNHGSTIDSETISLTANQIVPLQLEFYDDGGAAVVKLEWEGPGVVREFVKSDGPEVCKDITIDLSSTGSYTLTPDEVDPGYTDACGIDTRTLSKTNFTCSDLGTNSVTFTVTDVNGNASHCDFNVIVIGGPVLDLSVAGDTTCLGDNADLTIQLSERDIAYSAYKDGVQIGSSVTGNGSDITITVPTTGFSEGDNTIAFKAQSAVCLVDMANVATIVVNDVPHASAGGTTTICSNGTATVSGATSSNGTILWTHNGAGSLSNETSLNPIYTAVAADAGNIVSLKMNVTGSGVCGTKEATATYTINVDPLPTATAGGTTTICPNGTATVSGATSSNGTILWTHNGTGTLINERTVSPTYTAAIGDLGNTVILTMTVTGENSCSSETVVAEYYVVVEDDEKPTITAPSGVTVNVDSGSCNAASVDVALGTPVTADNCGVATVTNNAPVTYPLGATAVTWTVTDNSGLIATDTQIVTVLKENNIAVADVSGSLDPTTSDGSDNNNGNHCSEMNGLQAVTAPSGNTYSAGTSQIQFRVDRLCDSGAWSFAYSIGGVSVHVDNLVLTTDAGTETNASGVIHVPAETNYVLFTIDVANVVDNALQIDFAISDGGTDSAIKDAITIQHSLKIIPQIVDFE